MRYLKLFENFEEVPNTSEAVCTKCDCHPCQCTGDECEDCGCFPCECNDDIKENLDFDLEDTFSDWRLNSYLKIAREKYEDLSADEIIAKFNSSDSNKFKSEEEEEAFRQKWDSSKEGTFAYYNSMSPERLKELEKTFAHSFENPLHHNPRYVAYKKACQAKGVFTDFKDYTPRNFKPNKIF